MLSIQHYFGQLLYQINWNVMLVYTCTQMKGSLNFFGVRFDASIRVCRARLTCEFEDKEAVNIVQ